LARARALTFSPKHSSKMQDISNLPVAPPREVLQKVCAVAFLEVAHSASSIPCICGVKSMMGVPLRRLAPARTRSRQLALLCSEQLLSENRLPLAEKNLNKFLVSFQSHLFVTLYLRFAI